MNFKKLPDIDYLKSRLSYNHETGLLHWKDSKRTHRGHKPGDVAGNSNTGYVVINICKKGIKAHRIAWLLYYGVDPIGFEIDHIDGNGRNNKITNLRLATRSNNQQNTKKRRDNTSGVKGVHFCKKSRSTPWIAQANINNKRKYLGKFKTIEEASAAVKTARTKHHNEFANHG